MLSAKKDMDLTLVVVLGVAVPEATPLVVALNVPAEPDIFAVPDVGGLGPGTAAGVVVVDLGPSGLVVVPWIGPPVKVSLSALSTTVNDCAVRSHSHHAQSKPMKLFAGWFVQ